MSHYHYCKVCKVPVANCSDDSCKEDPGHPNAVQHFCSIHQPPDSPNYIPPTPPLRR